MRKRNYKWRKYGLSPRGDASSAVPVEEELVAEKLVSSVAPPLPVPPESEPATMTEADPEPEAENEETETVTQKSVHSPDDVVGPIRGGGVLPGFGPEAEDEDESFREEASD